MKDYIFILLIILISFSGLAQEEKIEVTAANYEQAVKFLGFNTNSLVDRAAVRPNWLADGTFWYEVTAEGEKEFVLINPLKKSRETATTKEGLPGNLAAESAAQRSYSDGGAQSPDGTKVAFIRDWNLWVRNIETEEETQLTRDGEENFGYATDNAGWRKSDRPILLWSPDSRKIATYRQDQRHVSDMYLVTTNVGAPELQAWKYPLPQDEDIIRIHRVIIEIDTPRVIELQMPPDARRGTLCDDISCSGAFDDNQWNEDATKLMFVSTSRDHKEAKLRIANALTGEVRDVFEEIVETQYESGQGSINWSYLPASNEVIWYSERDDWGHLYLYNAETGALKNQITKGDFVVTRVLKVDEKNKTIYFLANGREEGRDPYYSHLYSVNFNGRNLKLLTPGNGHHTVNISPNAPYFTTTYSQPNVPPVTELRTLDGKLVMNLEKADITRLQAMGWQAPTPVSVKSHIGDFDLYGLMFTPTHLDETKQYPVVNYVYPGPQGGGVGNRSFSPARSDHQALAELGFVVVVIDGTCNPGRSKSFHDACYGNIADNTLEDQMSGLRQLAEKYPYLDLDRVGIWGHSGGGYATAAAMFRYPEFYKVGVSQSGNHDNRNYEDDWGERYIGLLVEDEEGEDNYRAQANQTFAENLEGKLLLAHGGMDDNVPPYNTYLVVEALIKANKDFDLIIYPNARHGYGEDNNYMIRRRWDYFVKHLMGAEHPKEFNITRD